MEVEQAGKNVLEMQTGFGENNQCSQVAHCFKYFIFLYSPELSFPVSLGQDRINSIEKSSNFADR